MITSQSWPRSLRLALRWKCFVEGSASLTCSPLHGMPWMWQPMCPAALYQACYLLSNLCVLRAPLPAVHTKLWSGSLISQIRALRIVSLQNSEASNAGLQCLNGHPCSGCFLSNLLIALSLGADFAAYSS